MPSNISTVIPIVTTPSVTRQRVIGTPLPATPPATLQRIVATSPATRQRVVVSTPASSRAQRTATPNSLLQFLERIRNDPNISHPSTTVPLQLPWDPYNFPHTDSSVGWAISVAEAILKLNEDDSPLTKNSELKGSQQMADSMEIRKLLDTGTMQPAHLKDTNNEKKIQIRRLLRRVQGSIGGSLLFPEGPTTPNAVETDVIKSVFNSVVSHNGYQRLLSRYASTSR